MILYYAMGGGLGHITRTIAILRKAPWLAERARLMTSSALSGLATAVSPCPVDHVAGETLSSKRLCSEFLKNYVRWHGVRLMIVDSFPFGVAGELGWTALNIPCLLVARHVKWKAYTAATRGGRDIRCSGALAVEPLDEEQEAELKNSCGLSFLDSPILLEQHPRSIRKKGVLIIHSGNGAELAALMEIARERAGGGKEIEVIAPATGVYPAESRIAGYSEIVSGAGYNMSALASCAPPHVTHTLRPFERRYDDQFLRARRISDGMWRGSAGDGAEKAAKWLTERAECYLDQKPCPA